MITRERLTGRRQKYLVSEINHVIHAMNVPDNRTMHYELAYSRANALYKAEKKEMKASEEEERYYCSEILVRFF